MLTDAEFAAVSRISPENVREMDEDIIPFSCFALGIETDDGNFDLWKVRPTSAPTLKKMRKDELERREEERKANLAMYISRGWAFDKKD